MPTIDINCDLGEGYGEYRLADDASILPFISSANIACGFHAGDPAIMEATVSMAIAHNVAIGAHPGLHDLHGFGRRHLDVTPREIHQLILYQLGALTGFTKAAGTIVRHLKPHGALYHLAVHGQAEADAIANAVYQFDKNIVIYAPPGSQLIQSALKTGLRVAAEAFGDRCYLEDGSLMSRTQGSALITGKEAVVQQVLNIIKNNEVYTMTGVAVKIKADTICIHSDTPGAAQLVQHVYTALSQQDVFIKPPSFHES